MNLSNEEFSQFALIDNEASEEFTSSLLEDIDEILKEADTSKREQDHKLDEPSCSVSHASPNDDLPSFLFISIVICSFLLGIFINHRFSTI